MAYFYLLLTTISKTLVRFPNWQLHYFDTYPYFLIVLHTPSFAFSQVFRMEAQAPAESRNVEVRRMLDWNKDFTS